MICISTACSLQFEDPLNVTINFFDVQLPKRLARRLMDLQFLPYIVVTNPHIKRVYDSYQHAFETLHNLPQVRTVEQNAEFTILLKRLVDEHGECCSVDIIHALWTQAVAVQASCNILHSLCCQTSGCSTST